MPGGPEVGLSVYGRGRNHPDPGSRSTARAPTSRLPPLPWTPYMRAALFRPDEHGRIGNGGGDRAPARGPGRGAPQRPRRLAGLQRASAFAPGPPRVAEPGAPPARTVRTDRARRRRLPPARSGRGGRGRVGGGAPGTHPGGARRALDPSRGGGARPRFRRPPDPRAPRRALGRFPPLGRGLRPREPPAARLVADRRAGPGPPRLEGPCPPGVRGARTSGTGPARPQRGGARSPPLRARAAEELRPRTEDPGGERLRPRRSGTRPRPQLGDGGARLSSAAAAGSLARAA